MDQQALPVKRQLSCLNDLISDVEEEFAALAKAADVTLTTEVRVSQPVYVTGDEEQLYRLVSILVVKDTGVGIALEEQTRIFDRFYRVNSDRSRHTGGETALQSGFPPACPANPKGSGLGLPIAAAIATAHQGSIQVQSELASPQMVELLIILDILNISSKSFL